jgi:thiamine kinase-like enzyme
MNNDKKDSIKEIISFTESQLSQGKSMSVKITPIEELAGVNKTYRCNMVTTSGPDVSTESIILKYKPLDSFPPRSQAPLKSFPPQNTLEQYSNRFSNEIAALTYLNGIEFTTTIHPKLIHHDIKNLLIVTKDMGNTPTLLDTLNQPDLKDPGTYLKSYVRLLAELHSHTIHNWHQFKKIQEQFGSVSPPSDSTMDFRTYSSEFAALLDHLGSRYEVDKEAIIKEFNHVEEYVFSPDNELHGFIHADSGIQNVNVDIESKEMILFDYEFADTGYVLLDLAGLFLGFPQSGKGKRVPSRFYDALIKEYFESFTIVQDNPREKLAYALLHWTVGRIIGLWVFFLRDNLENLSDVDIEFINKTYTSNHECLNILENEAEFTYLRSFIEVVQPFISNTWKNVELLDYFSSLSFSK